MSDTNDPCQQERADLAALQEQLAAAKAEAQAARDVLIGYQTIIHKGPPYTPSDQAWIDGVVADCASEQDVYQHKPDQFAAIDNARPLLGAGYRYAKDLGKARDKVKALMAQEKAAQKKLKDCEDKAQHSQAPSPDQLVCGAPRTGHGHEGEPCHVHLGPDGTCQYHG